MLMTITKAEAHEKQARLEVDKTSFHDETSNTLTLEDKSSATSQWQF